MRIPHIQNCACHIRAALVRSGVKSSGDRSLCMGAVAVRPKVGAENGSSNSPFADKAAVFRRSCVPCFTTASSVVKRIAQRAGETVKTEPSMAVPPASQASRRTQLQLRHRYILTAANRAVIGKSLKCSILSPQTSHFRSVNRWGVATAIMESIAPVQV